MTQFKTLQFPNTPWGQAEKIRALQREASQGWRVVSETIVPGKFKGGKACCLFLIFAPCAFLAGHKDDIISVTLQRDTNPNVSQSEQSLSNGQSITPVFDRAKWNALLQYDSDISSAVEPLRSLDPKWMDEFASAYLVLNDKSYLTQIAARIIDKVRLEQAEKDALQIREKERKLAEQQKFQQVLQARRERYAVWYNRIWGTNQRRVWTVGSCVAFVILVLWLAGTFSDDKRLDNAEASGAAIGSDKALEKSAEIPLSVSPSFDCARVHSQILKLICVTPKLAMLDQQLAAAYTAALSNSLSPEELRMDERAWIRLRNNSQADVGTIQQMYQDRIAFLKTTTQ